MTNIVRERQKRVGTPEEGGREQKEKSMTRLNEASPESPSGETHEKKNEGNGGGARGVKKEGR